MRDEYAMITEPMTHFEFESTLLDVIGYFVNLHENLNIFHGDIKPDNLFFQRIKSGRSTFSLISTDSGSILKMDPSFKDDEKHYLI